MRARPLLLLAFVVLGLAACGGSSESSSTQTEAATTSEAATGAASSDAASTGAGEGAACTKEALADGAQPSFGNEPIEILDGFVCEGGWASGPVLVGESGSESQIEAAFIVEDKNGKWTVPGALPCDDAAVPEKVLDNSPCRVS